MVKSAVENLIAIKRGFEENHETFEALRIGKIRKSDIVKEYASFDEAYRSAKFLGHKKPETGLTHFRDLLSIMSR